MTDIEKIQRNFNMGYTMTLYGTHEAWKEQMNEDIETLLEALKQVKNDVSLDSINNCPVCNSDKLHQFKLHHIDCKDCKSSFDKSCD